MGLPINDDASMMCFLASLLYRSAVCWLTCTNPTVMVWGSVLPGASFLQFTTALLTAAATGLPPLLSVADGSVAAALVWNSPSPTSEGVVSSERSEELPTPESWLSTLVPLASSREGGAVAPSAGPTGLMPLWLELSSPSEGGLLPAGLVVVVAVLVAVLLVVVVLVVVADSAAKRCWTAPRAGDEEELSNLRESLCT